MLTTHHAPCGGRGNRPLVPALPLGRPHLGLGQPPTSSGGGVQQRDRQPVALAGGAALHRSQHRPRLPHLPRRLEHVPEHGDQQPGLQPLAPLVRPGIRRCLRWGNVSLPVASGGMGAFIVTEVVSTIVLNGKIPRADPGQVGQPPVRREAGQPPQQAPIQRDRDRHRAGRRLRRGDPGRARLPGEGVHLPRLARRAHSIAAQGGINAAKNYRTTATASSGSSTTPSRAATSAPARPTSIGSPR